MLGIVFDLEFVNDVMHAHAGMFMFVLLWCRQIVWQILVFRARCALPRFNQYMQLTNSRSKLISPTRVNIRILLLKLFDTQTFSAVIEPVPFASCDYVV